MCSQGSFLPVISACLAHDHVSPLCLHLSFSDSCLTRLGPAQMALFAQLLLWRPCFQMSQFMVQNWTLQPGYNWNFGGWGAHFSFEESVCNLLEHLALGSARIAPLGFRTLLKKGIRVEASGCSIHRHFHSATQKFGCSFARYFYTALWTMGSSRLFWHIDDKIGM